jgi:nitrite reductase/ring-hydroxylating ferredoxin subunit
MPQHQRGDETMSNVTYPASPQPTTPEVNAASISGDARIVSRRWLLFKAGIALNGVVGVVLAVPVLRYLFAPWKKDASFNSWTSLGPIEAFPTGETRLAYYRNPSRNSWDGETDNVACYVRREGARQFKVFAINCAHLGCPVRWFPQSQLFMCPCHGGVYYADGSRASGPPERGLFTYSWKIVSGDLQIDAGQMPTLSNSARLVTISINSGDSKCSG